MEVKKDKAIRALEKSFKGDLSLLLFYLSWIKNGMNSTKAYKELHPQTNDHSCRVLGSRWLTRVSTLDKTLLMKAYGLDHEKYFSMIQEGLEATKRDHFSGETEPDHPIRKAYHDKLGKLLGVEGDKPTVAIQNNIGEMKLEFVGEEDESKTA